MRKAMIVLVGAMLMGCSPQEPAEDAPAASGLETRSIEMTVVAELPPGEVFELWSTEAGVRRFFAPAARIGTDVGDPFVIIFNPEGDPEGAEHGTRGAVLRGVEEGLIWAFIGGIFIDLFSDAPFGFTVISLLCTTFVITSVGSAAFGSNIVFSLVSILAASLLNQVILVALLSLSENAPVWNESLIRIITLSTLINLCLLPLILWPLSWLHGTTRRQDVTL